LAEPLHWNDPWEFAPITTESKTENVPVLSDRGVKLTKFTTPVSAARKVTS